MVMTTYEPTDAEKEMLRIMLSEKSAWEDGEVFAIEKLSFIMRNIIKKARKNFYGVFDEEVDPVTQRKKIWVPLTEWVVENVIKNIDIDTKDIHVEPMKSESSVSAEFFNFILRNRLEKAQFGKTMNANNQNIVVDGMGFLKAWKENGELKITYQDRLHIIVDPAVSCADESPSIIEENVLSLPEFQQYTDWKNIDAVKGSKNVDRSGIAERGIGSTSRESEVPYVRVYERYGYAPKFVLTGDEKDRGEYVYVLSVASEIDSDPVIHKIKEVKKHPYQDFKFKEVLNRFDGRGIPEKLLSIQEYVNETVNTRLNTARIVQLGLWRVGAGVTTKQMKELFSGAAIRANQGDVERLNTGTIDASSYKDEEVAYEWAKRVTQTTNEDEVAASKPATNALIEERGANKGYDLIVENIYLNLAKFLKEKVVPIIIETLKDGEIEKITGDPQAIAKLEEPFVRNLVRSKNSQAFMETGQYLYQSAEQEQQAIAQLMQEMNKQYGNKRFIPILKQAFDTDYEIRIDPAGDVINKGVLAKQLTDVLSMLTGAGVPITELKDVAQELFDTMGLPGEKLVEKIGTTQQMSTAVNPQEVGTMSPPIEATQVPKPV
jgi:hypothetical protein